MTAPMITLVTTCPICGRDHEVMVYADDYSRWQNGELAQNAFPYLTANEREMLISGIDPECWESMFTEPEDEDEDYIDLDEDDLELGFDPYMGCYSDEC